MHSCSPHSAAFKSQMVGLMGEPTNNVKKSRTTDGRKKETGTIVKSDQITLKGGEHSAGTNAEHRLLLSTDTARQALTL